MPHRPTRDVDLLGYGPSDLQSIAQAFREIVNVVAQDGIVFDAASVRVEEIRKNAGYAGALGDRVGRAGTRPLQDAN